MRWIFTCLVALMALDARGQSNRVVLELPPGPGNPRNSEGSFVQLKDGRLLFIYSRFSGGSADHSAGELASRVSADGGITWSQQDLAVPCKRGQQNTMSVSLLRLASGDIALFYLVKDSINDCRPWMQTSTDEGATWSQPRLCIDTPGYYVVNNDRIIQLRSGRLVIPAALHPNQGGKFIARSTAMCWLSDDNGRTWKRSDTLLEAPAASRSGLQEPAAIELKDGRVMMLFRTDQGCQMRSYSDDGGLTWLPPERTDIASPISPASIRRIPGNGHLLLVWNNTTGKNRTPLTLAISKDDGQTWAPPRNIETDETGWYCYTAITLTQKHLILAYCAGEPTNKLGRTRLRAIELAWLDP